MMALDTRAGVRQAMCGSVFGDDGFFGEVPVVQELAFLSGQDRKELRVVCVCVWSRRRVW